MQTRERQIYRVTIIGSIANFLLMLGKFAAGVLGHSNAMIADAVHSLSDFATDIVVILFTKIAGKPKDANHNYGHGKFETFATLIVGFVLLAVGIGIFWNGANLIFSFANGGALEAPSKIAFFAAVASIIVKEILFQITKKVGNSVKSQAVTANAWHHRSDAFSSIGAAIGIAGAILFGKNWIILDPLAAVIVSIFIVKVAIELLKPAVDELLEKSLPDDVKCEILQIITACDSVSDPHNLRTRKVGNDIAIDVHIRVDSTKTVGFAHDIATDVEKKLKERFGCGTFISVHIEPLNTAVST